MNANASPNQNNDLNPPRNTNANPGRYRGNNRRGRGRGNSERQSQYRNNQGRDRRLNSNWRDSPAPPAQEILDIHDSSQWPSIQESSRSGRGRTSNSSMDRNQADKSRDERVENERDFSNNSYYQNESNRGGMNSRNSGFYQNSNRNYVDRYGQSSGNINRGRGQRYNNYNNRGYQYNNRRYQNRLFYQNLNGVIINPDVPFMPNQPMDSNYISVSYQHPPVMVNNLPSQESWSKPDMGPMEQVEFYFSAHNLASDKFMVQHMDNEGWVNLRLVYTFKRIKSMRVSYDDFVNEIMKSELLEVDKDGGRIRTKIDPLKWVDSKGEVAQPSVNSPTVDVEVQNSDPVPQVNVLPQNMQPFINPYSHMYPNYGRVNYGSPQYTQSYYARTYYDNSHETMGYSQYNQGYYNAYNEYNQLYGTAAPYSDVVFDDTDFKGSVEVQVESSQPQIVEEESNINVNHSGLQSENGVDELVSKVSKMDLKDKSV